MQRFLLNLENILSTGFLPFEEKVLLEEIRSLFLEGRVCSIDDLCKKLSMSKSELIDVCDTYNLKLPAERVLLNNHTLIGLIKKGLSIPQIGVELGIKRQAVEQKLKNNGLHSLWVQYRCKAKFDKVFSLVLVNGVREDLISLLKGYLFNRAKAEGEVSYYATLFYQNAQQSVYTYSDLTIFFRRYFDARNNNRRVSLCYLRSGLSFSTGSAGEILKSCGLKSLNKKRRNGILKKSAVLLERCFYSSLTSSEICYFTSFDSQFLNFAFKKLFGNNNRENIVKYRFGLKNLSLTKVSKIYEAFDNGITKLEDIARLSSSNKHIVAYVLNCRESFEEKIISALKDIYPDRSIIHPYL